MFFTFLMFKNSANAQVMNGKFYLSPKSTTFIQECNNTINIMVSTGSNHSDAANVVVKYNPGEIEILDADSNLSGTQIIPGSTYSSYADNVVDEATGRIRLTGFSIGTDFNGTGVFGTIVFRSKPGVTSTKFEIDFSGVGDTLDSNIAETITSNDVLGSVENGTYNFTSGDCTEDTTPPIIEPISPKNYDLDVSSDDEIIVKICDEESGVDIKTIEIYIDGEKYTYKDKAYFSYLPEGNCYIITIKPKSPFKENYPVLVIIKAQDLSGNKAQKTIIFNVPKEADDCLQRLSEKNADYHSCLKNLDECLKKQQTTLQALPQTGTMSQITHALGIPGFFSLIALLILIIHPYWRNPKEEDFIYKNLPKDRITKRVVFLIGLILALLGVIDLISIISVGTLLLYLLAILLLAPKIQMEDHEK